MVGAVAANATNSTPSYGAISSEAEEQSLPPLQLRPAAAAMPPSKNQPERKMTARMATMAMARTLS